MGAGKGCWRSDPGRRIDCAETRDADPLFVLSADATGLASYGHGGPYTVSAGTYTESITHGFGPPFSQLRGMKVSLQCSIEGDVWHSIGEIGGQTFDERWRRVPAATGK